MDDAATLRHFREVLAADPTNLELGYRVLATLVRSERFAVAEELARSLVQLEPERADRYVALGRVLSKHVDQLESQLFRGFVILSPELRTTLDDSRDERGGTLAIVREPSRRFQVGFDFDERAQFT